MTHRIRDYWNRHFESSKKILIPESSKLETFKMAIMVILGCEWISQRTSYQYRTLRRVSI